MPDFRYSDLLPLGEDDTPFRMVTTEGDHDKGEDFFASVSKPLAMTIGKRPGL